MTNDDRSVPRMIENVSGARGVDGGSRHLCWIVGNGGVRCAGKDDDGQVGNGPGEIDELTTVTVTGYDG